MPMKTHRATRLAEIDEEINSRPYSNIIAPAGFLAPEGQKPEEAP